MKRIFALTMTMMILPGSGALLGQGRAPMVKGVEPEAEAAAMAKEAADSRIWAGIHYPMDLEAGMAVGRAVVGRKRTGRSRAAKNQP